MCPTLAATSTTRSSSLLLAGLNQIPPRPGRRTHACSTGGLGPGDLPAVDLLAPHVIAEVGSRASRPRSPSSSRARFADGTPIPRSVLFESDLYYPGCAATRGTMVLVGPLQSSSRGSTSGFRHMIASCLAGLAGDSQSRSSARRRSPARPAARRSAAVTPATGSVPRSVWLRVPSDRFGALQLFRFSRSRHDEGRPGQRVQHRWRLYLCRPGPEGRLSQVGCGSSAIAAILFPFAVPVVAPAYQRFVMRRRPDAGAITDGVPGAAATGRDRDRGTSPSSRAIRGRLAAAPGSGALVVPPLGPFALIASPP